jgi:dipeptidyl aminopeptidase/acylaminoacyl peptidase
LILHGNADKAVPIIQGKIMLKKLQSSEVESQYIEFKDTSHFPTIEQAQRGVSVALKWFEKHLGQ